MQSTPANIQSSIAGRYAWPVRALSFLAFGLAFLGWLNERALHWFGDPVWLNHYTEYLIIIVFGIWRIAAERNTYTRKRLIVLVSCVAVLWWFIPWALPVPEPYTGELPSTPVFPSLHTPGTITFFLTLVAVLLFGRRVICGWNCPCVGIRDTVGFAFRTATVRGDAAWKFRHFKWLFFVLYVVASVLIIASVPAGWKEAYLAVFYGIIAFTYFGTFFLAPVVGNRFYCRYLCPYGATFGLLNRIGFFGIDYTGDTCTDCGLCAKVCDMGIPIVELGKKNGRVKTADCMGCGRCVTDCPTQSLAFRDARDVLGPARSSPARSQNKTGLLASAAWKERRTKRAALAFAIALLALIALAGRMSTLVGGQGQGIRGGQAAIEGH